MATQAGAESAQEQRATTTAVATAKAIVAATATTKTPRSGTTARLPAATTTAAGRIEAGQKTQATPTSTPNLLQAMIQQAMVATLPALEERISASVRRELNAQQPTGQPLRERREQVQGALPVTTRIPACRATTAALTGGLEAPAMGQMPGQSILENMQVPLLTSAAPSVRVETPRIGGEESFDIAPSSTPIDQLASLVGRPISHVLPPTTEGQGDAIVIGASTPPVPRKLAERIWRGEFVEMQELLPARLGVPEPSLLDVIAGKHRQQSTRTVQDIHQWVQCFNTYTSVVAIRHPERVRELLSYSSIIVRAAREFYDTPWLSYDSHVRRHAAAVPSVNLAVVDSSLWTLYFAQAKPRAHCVSCDGVGHMQASCPQQSQAGTRRLSPYNVAAAGSGNSHGRYSSQLASPYARGVPICRRWNFQQCLSPDCRFRHVCLLCMDPSHPRKTCSVGLQGSMSSNTATSTEGTTPVRGK